MSFQYKGRVDGILPLLGDIERHGGKYKVIIIEGINRTNMILEGQGLLEKLHENGFDGDEYCTIKGPIKRGLSV